MLHQRIVSEPIFPVGRWEGCPESMLQAIRLVAGNISLFFKHLSSYKRTDSNILLDQDYCLVNSQRGLKSSNADTSTVKMNSFRLMVTVRVNINNKPLNFSKHVNIRYLFWSSKTRAGWQVRCYLAHKETNSDTSNYLPFFTQLVSEQKSEPIFGSC